MPSEFDAFFADGRSFLLGHHGTPAVLYKDSDAAPGAAAVSVTAIVGPISDELLELPGDGTRQSHRHRPLTVALAEVPNPKRPDQFTIDGEIWTVHAREPQDGGMAKLVVVRPVRVDTAGRRVER